MALINSTGFAHVRITVTDIARSKAFYDQVFGWPAAIDASGGRGPGGAGRAGELLRRHGLPDPAGHPVRAAAGRLADFDSEHTGLDHVSFAVDSREDLVRAAQRLTEAGITHGDIIDLTDAGMAILSFQDPDDINIELTAPLG